MNKIKYSLAVVALNLFLVVPTLIFTVPPALMSTPLSPHVSETLSYGGRVCLKTSPIMAVAAFLAARDAHAGSSSGSGGGGGGSTDCCSGASYGSFCSGGSCQTDPVPDSKYMCSYACSPCKSCARSKPVIRR